MRAAQHLQLDPLDIGARAHDLILHSRVRGYKKSFYDDLVYKERKFFEWGAWLATRPIEEWPYWSVLMDRSYKRYKKSWLHVSPAAQKNVLEVLRNEGAKRNRHFQGGKVPKQYRGGKQSSLALYQLWIKGDVVCSSRDRFERIYDLAHRFVPSHFLEQASDDDADLFMIQKAAAFNGISRLTGLGQVLMRDVPEKKLARLREQLLSDGVIEEIAVEGWKETHYILSSSRPLIETLAGGETPKVWLKTKAKSRIKASNGEMTSEVLFLSPLDNVSARGRAKKLFNFDYVWEVYKPLEKRRWGYYTLPILWGDKLVARIEPSLDRKTGTLRVLGLWFEDPRLGKDGRFQKALALALIELKALFAATSFDLSGISNRGLSTAIDTYISASIF
jgi:uncharacterized protein YcaQ